MNTFKTHIGDIVAGKRLTDVLNKVANDWEQLARDIRKEDAYAAHVTDAEKDSFMIEMIERSKEIRNGDIRSFTVWQRVNNELTGNCVAFLP